MATPVTPPDASSEASGNRFYGSEMFLGSIVALLTILTAVAAFQASRLSIDAGRASGRSVRTLLESNAAFLSSSQQVSADLTLYGLSLEAGLDEDQEAYYQSSFSLALQEAIERNESDPGAYPFDEGYDEFQFSLADELFGDVFELVDEAGEKRGQSQRFQLATFVFAIGLAFSSWASLADDGSRIRHLFALFASATGLIGAAAYILALQSIFL